MVINLHERLSEFSYGYGVTREIEQLLESVGCKATPFLPSLIHEKQLGFDVGFSKPGGVVLAQFKLGQELKRFRLAAHESTVPVLDHPFWQFRIDVDDHQFQRLVEFENNGAEVYYVAPRFATWQAYDAAFQSGKVLENSLLAKPSDIVHGLGGPAVAKGIHRIAYDCRRRYVCSDPRPFPEYRPQEMALKVRKSLSEQGETLEAQIKRLYSRERPERGPGALRSDRTEALLARGKTQLDGMAAIVALEAWTLGAQAIFVNITDPEDASESTQHL